MYIISATGRIPTIDATPIETFVLSGPQRSVYLDPPTSTQPDAPLKRGLALEFPLYYPKLNLLDLRLNGRPLKQSPTDGYQQWYSPWEGYTLVRVNIPPAARTAQNIFIVTCAYKPAVQREYGWQPPGPAR